jgi:hypothetical protein
MEKIVNCVSCNEEREGLKEKKWDTCSGKREKSLSW